MHQTNHNTTAKLEGSQGTVHQSINEQVKSMSHELYVHLLRLEGFPLVQGSSKPLNPFTMIVSNHHGINSVGSCEKEAKLLVGVVQNIA